MYTTKIIGQENAEYHDFVKALQAREDSGEITKAEADELFWEYLHPGMKREVIEDEPEAVEVSEDMAAL